jgi:hypothetical protein
MFPGNLVTAKDTELLLLHNDGTSDPDSVRANRNYSLTNAFSPLVLKQLLGASLVPLEQPLATMTARLSLAGQEVWASGYAVNDDKTTPQLELKELQNFKQFGMQLEVELGGKIQPQLLYAFRLELMMPFYTDIKTSLSGFDLINTDLSFKLGLKLSSWASLDYVFMARRMPLVVNQWQVVNNLVLSITANIL